VGLQALEKELKYEWRGKQWLKHEAQRPEPSDEVSNVVNRPSAETK
jgi:hypothetical protein